MKTVQNLLLLDSPCPQKALDTVNAALTFLAMGQTTALILLEGCAQLMEQPPQALMEKIAFCDSFGLQGYRLENSRHSEPTLRTEAITPEQLDNLIRDCQHCLQL